MERKIGSYRSRLDADAKEAARGFATSHWDVIATLLTERPGTIVLLHLPDIRRSLFQTTSDGVERDKDET
jgi:hypothetical protein